MTKSSFSFFTIKAIHKKKKEQNKNIFELLNRIEIRPLNVSVENNRYINLQNEVFITIQEFTKSNNGYLLKLRKCKYKDIKGSFLGSGEEEYDVTKVLNNNFKRDDSVIVEESFVKIFNNDVMIMQAKRDSFSSNQLKYYLEELLKEYRFEIFPIYQNTLFEDLENENIKKIILDIGFAPKDPKFNNESYSGAAKVELHFKKGRQSGFLNFNFFKNILKNRTMNNFGILDNGHIDNGTITMDGNRVIKLDIYQLKECKEFKNKQSMIEQINSHLFFDSLFKKHSQFLKEYLLRDNRYKE